MSVAARRFAVSVITLKRLVQLQQQTESLQRCPIVGGVRGLGPEHETLLRTRLQVAPDATVREHCAWWAEVQGQLLSEPTMWRALRRLGWTHKKCGYPDSCVDYLSYVSTSKIG